MNWMTILYVVLGVILLLGCLIFVPILYIYLRYFKETKMDSIEDKEEIERFDLLLDIRTELSHAQKYVAEFKDRYGFLETKLNKYKFFDSFKLFDKALDRYISYTSLGLNPNLTIGEYKFMLNKLKRLKVQIDTLLRSKENQLERVEQRVFFIKNFLLSMERLRKNAISEVNKHGYDTSLLREDLYSMIKNAANSSNLYDFFGTATKLDEAYKKIINLSKQCTT